MKIAIIGSRSISSFDLSSIIPTETDCIITGGATGIDTLAAEYAKKENIPLLEILPDYKRYKRGAPLHRNDQIIELADLVIAIWDEKSHGTLYVINKCRKMDKKIKIYVPKNLSN